MSKSCPLLYRKIDATISKVSTALILAGIAVYLFTQHVTILLFIIVDFVIRLSGKRGYSPVYLCALAIQKTLHLEVKMEDEGGKRLASFFGLAFTAGLVITHFQGWTLANGVLAIVFIGCAVPEILFGYCIACKFYTLANKIYPKGFA